MDKKHVEDKIKLTLNTLLDKLHTEDEYNSKTFIDELHSLAQSIQADNANAINLHTTQHNFETEYKAIAQESIDSYEQTTQSVKKINEEHKRITDESSGQSTIAVEDIMHNFANMHSQIEEQMHKANSTIQSLQRQVKILEKTSNLDPLTRVFNRRALDSYLENLCKMKKHATDTHILLVDIDDFKDVNDTYGHLAGDRVLMFLAKLIGNILRDGDKLFRFGGEEFLIILNRASEESCLKVSERILNGVRSNTLLYKKEHKIKITLSIGATSFLQQDDASSFIDRADKALYKAKANGKNQMIIG